MYVYFEIEIEAPLVNKHVNMDYGLEFQLGVSTVESQLGDMTWSFANQGRRFQIWHIRLEILTPWPH